MKRLLAFTLSALLLCPMTAFGAQTEEAKAVYQEVLAKSQTTSDMNAYYDMTVHMSGDLFKELEMDSMDMRIEMNARFQNMTNPAQMRYQTFTRMSMPEQQPMEYSMYYGDGYCYMDMLGQKVKYPMDLESVMEQALSTSKMFETSTDYFKDLTLRTEGDSRILSYTMDDAMLNDYMKAVLDASGMDAMLDQMSFTVSNISGEYIVNPDGYYTKANVKMDMTMTMMGETINASVVADVGIADPGQPVVINVPNPGEYTEQPLE